MDSHPNVTTVTSANCFRIKNYNYVYGNPRQVTFYNNHENYELKKEYNAENTNC